LSEAAQDRLAQILDEYLVAAERGAPISPDELLRRHPADAEHLRGYLSGLKLFHNAAVGLKLPPPPFVGRLQPAQVIGDFRLLREIGRGGMGVVFEALQISLQRKVALKVLPFTAGHDEKQIHRFRNEALAAAHVEHANIVPVYAIGEDNGVHYYAMQLIEGQSLSAMLADSPTSVPQATGSTAPNHRRTTCGMQNGETQGVVSTHSAYLSPGINTTSDAAGPEHKQRATSPLARAATISDRVQAIARLGIQAAEALHAAHEIGVVHRDVKPSNLLVDDQGKLWVTDFGLARCREHAGLTKTGDVLGTMRYMSPEQSLGRSGLVDHRTDIYSLGVSLYELATGHHPAGDLCDAQLVLSRDAFHHKSLRHWNHSIPRDFETIVLKAIAEFPYERYGTAQEFADDLRRFLDGRPILASRPSLASRAGKWARRHRGPVYAATAVLLMAFVGHTFYSLLLTQKNRDIVKALAAERDRVKERGLVLDRFTTQLVDQLAAVPGAEGVRHQLLQDGIALYQSFEAQAAGDPTLKPDLALAYGKLGTLNGKLGKNNEALAKHLAARDLWEELVAAEPANADHSRNLALCRNNLGLSLADSGRGDEALESLHDARRALEKLAKAEPESHAISAALATTYNNIGLVLRQLGHNVPAAERFRDAISIQEELVSRSPDSEPALSGLATSFNNLASVEDASAPNAAVDTYRKAIDIQRRLVKNCPVNRSYQGDLARTYNNLGYVLVRQNDYGDGELCYRSAVTIQENLVMASPFADCYRRDLAISYNNLGMAQSRFERLAAAETSFRRALDLQQTLLAAEPNNAKTLSDTGGIYNNLALLLDRQNRPAEAELAFQDAIRLQQRALDAAPESSRYRELLRNHFSNFARSLRSHDKPQEADRLVQEHKSLLAGKR
jgi:serine/threonine protein kinase/Tfp pilus assembly protein PilF